MDNNDIITYHGKIVSIRDNVDERYVWFDIMQDNISKDKDGIMKNYPSFFSARIYKEYRNNLVLNSEVYVKGVPKGYIDKKGLRQNYIHVNYINNSFVSGKISYDKDGVMLWDGKRCESIPLSKKEKEEIDELLKDFK